MFEISIAGLNCRAGYATVSNLCIQNNLLLFIIIFSKSVCKDRITFTLNKLFTHKYSYCKY